jgi:hypothetical protein
MDKLRRPPRTSSPFIRRRPQRDDAPPPGHALVHMASPADDSFSDAVHRMATVLREGRQYEVIATVPRHVRDEHIARNGTSVDDAEAASLGLEAWAIAEIRKDDRRLLFKIAAAVDDFPAVAMFAEQLSLMPKVLRAFLAIVRPWHLALLGIDGFADCDQPSPEQLQELTESVLAQLRRWGVKIEVVNDREDG